MLHYYTIRSRGYLNEAALSKGQIYMSTLKLFLHLFKHMFEHLFTGGTYLQQRLLTCG